MSFITIEISDVSVPASLISVIHKCMNMSNLEVIERIKTSRPIYDREIFDNNSEQEFELIRNLLREFADTGVPITIKEDGHAITPEILENIMVSSEAISEDLRELNELRHS